LYPDRTALAANLPFLLCGAITFIHRLSYGVVAIMQSAIAVCPSRRPTRMDRTGYSSVDPCNMTVHTIGGRLLLLLTVLAHTRNVAAEPLPKDKWPLWPAKMHAELVQNRSGSLAIVDHYFDFKGGSSLLVIRSQLGSTLMDYEFR